MAAKKTTARTAGTKAKAAEKVTATASAEEVTEETTKVVNEAAEAVSEGTEAVKEPVEKATSQYFSMLEQGQTAVVGAYKDAYKTLANAVGKIDLDSVPGVSQVKPDFTKFQTPAAEALERYFDFSIRVVENQREFAHRILKVEEKV